ncbi:MAG: OmpA family protein [Hyphomicrobiaceae bacterium]
MKCHPLRWVWGLIPLAVFSWMAALSIKEPVERDLRKRVTEDLVNANLGWAKLKFDGRDGILSGQAEEEGEPSKALILGNKVYGVRVLDGQADLLRKVQPFTWGASHTDNRVVLSGFVPNQKAHKGVLAAAKSQFPKAEIIDRLEFARGNPPVGEWLDGVKFGLKQLAQLKRGSAELSGLDVSVSGEAGSAGVYKDVKAALTNLPKPLKLAADKVTAPFVDSYAWMAKLSGNSVALTGYVPSERMRETLLAHAKQAFGKTGIADKMELGEGAPNGWEKAAKISLDQLATLQEGTAELKNGQLTLSGTAASEATAETTKKAFKSQVPEWFKAAEAIKGLKPVPPPEDAAKRDAELAQAKREAELAAQAKRDAELAAQAKKEAERDVAEAKRLAEQAAEDKAKKDAAEAAVAAIATKAATACEGDLRSANNAGSIQFERASDVIVRASLPTLRKLAQISAKCENVLIEIEGHTDSEGIPERNQPLSERRAQSVVNFLVDNGINADRIKAIGYGDTKPIAPNDTADNRAKNRRIEFSVKSK